MSEATSRKVVSYLYCVVSCFCCRFAPAAASLLAQPHLCTYYRGKRQGGEQDAVNFASILDSKRLRRARHVHGNGSTVEGERRAHGGSEKKGRVHGQWQEHHEKKLEERLGVVSFLEANPVDDATPENPSKARGDCSQTCDERSESRKGLE